MLNRAKENGQEVAKTIARKKLQEKYKADLATKAETIRHLEI